MKKLPMEIYQAFGQGLLSGIDSWKDFVADDITFVEPVDQAQGLQACTKLNEGFMPMIRSNEMKQVKESGNFVITQALIDVAMPSGKTIQLDMTDDMKL